MIGSGAAASFFSKINKYSTGKLKPNKTDEGLVADGMNALLNFTGKNPANAAMVAGGAAGAAGGIISSDRDQSWYVGGAQGAFAASQITRHGLSGLGAAGAAAGAIYGMMSDDTSIMSGAFMGASLGAMRRYKNAPGEAVKRGQRLRANMKPKGPSNAAINPKSIGMGRKAKFGINAIANAVKRDVGMGWRSTGNKSSRSPNVNKRPWTMKQSQDRIAKKRQEVKKRPISAAKGLYM